MKPAITIGMGVHIGSFVAFIPADMNIIDGNRFCIIFAFLAGNPLRIGNIYGFGRHPVFGENYVILSVS